MKTLKFFNSGLLVLAALLLVTAVAEFANGNILHGICNILWMLCEVLFFLVNKHYIEIKQENLNVYGFLFSMDNTIEEFGSAIITYDEDGKWEIHKGIAVEHGTPSCSAENNDNIEIANNAEGGEK